MYLPLDAYQPAASAVGMAGGAGLGGMIGHGLGMVSDTLSAPRRMIWNALGLPDSGSEVLHQHFGMDPDSLLTKGLGFGLEMAGDPLTYLGGIPGLGAGAKLGAHAGEGLLEAAVAHGPQYAGGMEKLLGAPGIPELFGASEAKAAGLAAKYGVEPVEGHTAGALGALLGRLQASPGIDRALGEIPEGSSYLGHGAEALALKTPAGDVLRLQPPGEFGAEAWHGLQRPDIPEMLQPNRAGLAGDVRVERTPFAAAQGVASSPREMAQFYKEVANPMSQSVLDQGYLPADIHSGNVGMFGGERKIIDPGAVIPAEGGPQPPALGQVGEQPGGLTGRLLRALGSDQAVQARLAQQARDMADPSLVGAGVQASVQTPTAERLRRILGFRELMNR